jgi:putative effector of murein hydrolase
VLIALALLTHVRYPQYIAQTHWLVWLLGPTTVAFALPLHENRQLLRKHWMSIATGVIVASGVSIATTVWFAQAFGLPVDLQKGLAVRSVTTPFAIEAERVLGGPTDLAALFVLLTGVSGMLIGETILRLLPRVRSKLAAGAILGGAAHGSGVAKARQFGDVQAVVASLVMMIAGAVNVLLAPWVKLLFF